MPRGKYDSNIRKLRYARLREVGVPRNLAMLIRDWCTFNYAEFLINVKDYGLDYALSKVNPEL